MTRPLWGRGALQSTLRSLGFGLGLVACAGHDATISGGPSGASADRATTAEATSPPAVEQYRDRWVKGVPTAPSAAAEPAESEEPEPVVGLGTELVGDAALPAPNGGFDWQLPAGFPTPVEPADNPMSVAKVELGRHLFYDQRLSRNQTQSCATCHKQRLAFTDGRVVSEGSTGSFTPRNAMSLANVAYAATLTWSNPLHVSLERQAVIPIFGDDPVELGQVSQSELEARLRAIPEYPELFRAAFPEQSAITYANVARGLASFQRALISGSSPFDAWLYGGDESVLSESAKRGFVLFNSERFECFHCHQGFNLSDHVDYRELAFPVAPFYNTGLYNLDGQGAYPEPNTGTFNVTLEPTDMGRFKTPTLRNIAVTAPYMHDGSIETLFEVLDHYAAGGRTIEAGPHAGVGSENPYKENFVRGFEATQREREDVVAFLESLTDEDFLRAPALSDPWPAQSTAN